MDTFAPPKYSLNSFFVRHVAHPKRMKYISGLNNARICAVNDDGYFNRPPQPPMIQPSSSLSMADGKSGGLLSRRKEKLVPPSGIWKTYGLIDDTEKWRKELNSLATSVGLITEDDIDNYKKRKERDERLTSIQQLPKSPSHRLSRTPLLQRSLQKTANKPGTSNGTASSTRALNEPLNTGRKSRQSRSHSRLTGLASSSTKKYVVNQADREVWVREVIECKSA